MFKNSKVIIFILLVSLTSCNSSVTVDFKIINETSSNLDSLYIEPNQKKQEKIIAIEPNGEVNYQIDMSHVQKTDGSYQIFYKMNNEQKFRDFGYYTNGHPSGYPFELKIKNDTIIIQEGTEKY